MRQIASRAICLLGEQAGPGARREAARHTGRQRYEPFAQQAGRRQTRRARKLKGAAYDRAYVENEVAYRKSVNSARETQLIASASNAELKSLIETVLKVFQGHEQHAEHVASDLK